jgi:hypothetical protein
MLEMLRKDLRRKSLPQNRSRRAKPAVSELFQALNAVKKKKRGAFRKKIRGTPCSA